MGPADICIGLAAACYVGAAVFLCLDKQYIMGIAFVCWASANTCLMLIAGGMK